ncbi:hypothetical protein [Dethiothermospora halolimnae]|uniref:hypothetical protein n=1 Tax=Dethiothermospora halolimnae TaxID=3114390 RepID=UPI003CCBA464
MILEKMLNRLTDNYRKDKDSNIYKLFAIIAPEIEELNQAIKDIKTVKDVDTATGYHLDRIGSNVKEYRGNKNDDKYRQFIKTKIKANLSKGDIETLNEVAEVVIGDNFISLTELWNNPLYDNEQAALLLNFEPNNLTIPFELERVAAGGVRLYSQAQQMLIDVGISETFRTSDILSPICGTFNCGSRPLYKGYLTSFEQYNPFDDVGIEEGYMFVDVKHKIVGTFKVKQKSLYKR